MPIAPSVDFSVTKSPDMTAFQQALLELQQYNEPEFRIGLNAQVVGANTFVEVQVDPPAESLGEWLLYGFYTTEVVVIDTADQIWLYYYDQLTGALITLLNAAIGGFYNNRVIWPIDAVTGSANNASAMQPARQPLLLKRKNKERYLNLVIRFTTTATVGNRTFNYYWLYRERQRLIP